MFQPQARARYAKQAKTRRDRRCEEITRAFNNNRSIQQLADDLGINRQSLVQFLRHYLPELHPKTVRWADDPKPPTLYPRAPMMRSIMWGGTGITLQTINKGEVYVCCGPCGRAFPRPSLRRATQLQKLHLRMHAAAETRP